MEVGAVVIDVNDLDGMRAFWEEALGYQAELIRSHWVKLAPPEGDGINVSLQLVTEPRVGKNRLHLDLYTTDPREEIRRLTGLGATLVNDPDDHDFTVLADPEGNLFCVIDKASG